MVLAQKQKFSKGNKIESQEINPSTHGHVIFNNGGKNIEWRKDSLFKTWYRKNWIAMCKTMKLEHFLTPYTKTYSKLFKDLNFKTRNYKTLRGQHRQCTLWHKLQQYPLWPTSWGVEMKTKLNKWGLLCLVSQSCLTLCDPMDCSSPGSSVHGDASSMNTGVIAISFSRESSQPKDPT